MNDASLLLVARCTMVYGTPVSRDKVRGPTPSSCALNVGHDSHAINGEIQIFLLHIILLERWHRLIVKLGEYLACWHKDRIAILIAMNYILIEHGFTAQGAVLC